jgi:DNA-binding transcriptional MerR regulator
MRYTINDLVETSGIAPRTIRRYIALGVIPPPDGNGGGALYTDHHLELVIAIARMRAQGVSLAVCIEALSKWSEPRLRRYLKESEPQPVASPPAAAETHAESAALPPLAEAGRLPPKKGGKSPKGDLKVAGSALPLAKSFRFVPLLPDLMLCVGDAASPLVQRIALEIFEKYGAGT